MINSISSSWCPVKSGVPQGFVLSPTLSVTDINDINRGVCSMFADYTYSKFECRLFTEWLISKLVEWNKDWQMSSKCEVMHNRRSNPNNDYFYIHNVKLISFYKTGPCSGDQCNYSEVPFCQMQCSLRPKTTKASQKPCISTFQGHINNCTVKKLVFNYRG